MFTDRCIDSNEDLQSERGTTFGIDIALPLLTIPQNTEYLFPKDEDRVISENPVIEEDDTIKTKGEKRGRETKSGGRIMKGGARQNAGIKAPVTIVKVRKYACETLIRTLLRIDNDKESTPPSLLSQPSIKGTQRINDILEKLCEKFSIFSSVNVDELDETSGGGINQKGGDSINNRKKMVDGNREMFDLDTLMYEVIVTIYSIYSNQTSNPILKNKAFNVLRNFILTSSAKEYLDTGQLYAIIEPTIRNNENGWTSDIINERVRKYLRNENVEFPQNFPQKPMLETIDGAATRIAANAHFTAYCNFTLEDHDTNKKIDSTHYIDNVDSYTLGIFMSNDDFISSVIEVTLSSSTDFDNDEKMIFLAIRKYFKQLCCKPITSEESMKGIDYLYYILSTEKYEKYKKLLLDIKKITEVVHKVILIPKHLYFMASVASFLTYSHNSKSTEDIKKTLVECNFDSLCHDNGDSSVYILIMILMLILKNDSNTILNNLELMGIVTKNSTNDWKEVDSSWNNSYVNSGADKYPLFPKYYNPGKNEKDTMKNPNEYSKITEGLLKSLNNEQQLIFRTLASKNASKIESRLYTRLRDKCCYVFPVISGECNDYVAIVATKDNADIAFSPVNNELELQQALGNSPVFPITSLHAGIIIPDYTSCAIDAPLKHSFSLSNISGIGLHKSTIYATSVTRVDAAAVNIKNSTIINKPICIPIPVVNLNVPDARASFSFIYEFFYGRKEEATPDARSITCQDVFNKKDSINGYMCEQYKNIIRDFDNNKFYKGANPYNDANYYNILETFLKKFIYITDDTIRRLFSNLISNGIVKVNTKGNVTRLPEAKRDEAKGIFVKAFINYMGSTESEINKLKFYYQLKFLLNIIKETYSSNELTEEQVASISQKIDKQITTIKYYLDSLSQRQITTGGRRQKYSLKLKGGGDTTTTDEVEMDQTGSNTEEIDSGEMVQTGPNVDITQEEIESEESGEMEQGDVKVVAKPDNYDYENDIEYGEAESNIPSQLSYFTMFGKFGFDMTINRNNEFVLQPINTLYDYVQYLNKYGLNDKIIELSEKILPPNDNIIKRTYELTDDDISESKITVSDLIKKGRETVLGLGKGISTSEIQFNPYTSVASTEEKKLAVKASNQLLNVLKGNVNKGTLTESQKRMAEKRGINIIVKPNKNNTVKSMTRPKQTTQVASNQLLNVLKGNVNKGTLTESQKRMAEKRGINIIVKPNKNNTVKSMTRPKQTTQVALSKTTARREKSRITYKPPYKGYKGGNYKISLKKQNNVKNRKTKKYKPKKYSRKRVKKVTKRKTRRH